MEKDNSSYKENFNFFSFVDPVYFPADIFSIPIARNVLFDVLQRKIIIFLVFKGN